MQLKYYLPHIVFFSVFIVVLAPVLYYYHRRNPSPRFRPGIGEMTLITVAALFIGGLASYFLGNIFRGDQRSSGKFDHGAGWSEGDAAPREKPGGKD